MPAASRRTTAATRTATTTAAPATATATSRAIGLALAALALIAGGCGSHPASPAASAAFAWLKPAPAPGGWHVIQIASGATMAYPPGWRAIRGDPGTATAALRDARHAFVGYLNLTPRQGGETLANWGSFRTAHNVHEGDRDVVRLATAGGLRFRTGRGACVKDSYVTSTGERYTEIACLVAGHASSVIVGAAPPGTWPQVKALIERSISALTT